MSPIEIVGPLSRPTTEKATRVEVRKAAEAFEALLLQSLLQRMRSAQLQHGFFGEGTGASTYEAMFEQHLAETLAEGSPLGFADLLEARLLDRPLAEVRELARETEHGRNQAAVEAALATGGSKNAAFSVIPVQSSSGAAAQVVPGETDE